MKIVHAIAFVLLVIGGLNWGLVGVGGWDLVALVFGAGSILAKIVYILVGLSAIYLAVMHKQDCKHCESSTPAAPQM